ncbi:chloride channel protein [Intrasporangium sp.]|uniref:chloride channel protein n=1 Tax=Intrasporangium sp. TaxID=1925024 RepID=UPI0032221024
MDPDALTASTRWRTRGRAWSSRLGRQVRDAPYLRKWLVLGVLLGVIAGLGAVVFYESLRLATHLFLGLLGGYQIPTVVSEGGLVASAGFVRPWAIPLIVAFGGLLSGVVVIRFAPEAEGHGTDAAIDAVHRNPRGVRLRAVVVKIVASAITLGSGGSGGREGPTAQISSGFGSFLARSLDLSPGDGRIAVAAGIGSGIGSIFGAPLGGALLSAEIVYRDDIEVEAIIPAMISSIIGYAVSSAFLGFQPMFGFATAGQRFFDPAQLGWFALIGVVSGLVGLAYAKGFYTAAGAFQRMAVPRWLRPAIGGLLTGLIALALPQVLGTGYGWVQTALGEQLLGLPLWVVLALPFAKILATALSIGSGGSGGIFGPGMVIGGFTGAAMWRLLEPVAPAIPHSPAPFVIVAMMATFGSICRAPLAVMIMVAEMTGSLSALAPAMIAVGLATLIVRVPDATIYRSQLRNRADSPAHRLQRGMPLLGSLPAVGSMTVPRVVLAAGTPVAQAWDRVRRARVPGAPVVDGRGVFVGSVPAERLRDEASAGRTGPVARLADPTAQSIVVTDHLDAALEALLLGRASWVPVLDRDRRVSGIITTADIVRGYRNGLRTHLRQVTLVSPDTEVVDSELQAGSRADGATVEGLHLPAGTIVMTLQRDGVLVPCHGGTILRAGDRLGILTHVDDAERVGTLLVSPAGRPGGPGSSKAT